MLVPTYWAEARVQEKDAGRQITVRRWGWSDESEAAALAKGEERARAAIAQIRQGETERRIPRRERRVGYNGAEGVPIREEIVARHDEVVVTRNAYGAECLNVRDVMIVDIDDASGGLWQGLKRNFFLIMAGYGVAGTILNFVRGKPETMMTHVAIAGVALVLWGVPLAFRKLRSSRVASEKADVPAPVRAFSRSHPDWLIHVYRTPLGYRLIAAHDLFRAQSDAVAIAMKKLGADPVYVLMCHRQDCFRARLTPKPWRIGMSERLLPRTGIWKLLPEHIPKRTAWLATYAEASRPFAACRFIETLGSGAQHPKAEAVRRLHDELSGALSGKPIA